MKRLVVLGAGESGVGAAILGKKEGWGVFVSDFGGIAKKYKEVLLNRDISFEENKHSEEQILNANVVVKSPGIPDKAPLIKKLIENGIQVISEIEFASWYTKAKLIGITGSNGKTTTTSLTYHILKEVGLNVGLAGNIGKSFALQVAECSYDYYVLELSSFQLDGIDKLTLDVAVLLNITPDHLDRYDYKIENYAKSKFRIIKNATKETKFIYCSDDKIVNKIAANLKGDFSSYLFGKQDIGLLSGAFDEAAKCIDINNSIRITTNELPLKGMHNTFNIIAALLVANVIGLEDEKVLSALKTFKAIEHRLESVCVKNGIEYINDSKATNVDAVWYALDSMNENVIWIAGGVDKGNDYSTLMDLVQSKVKGIVCLGKDNSKLHATFKDITELTDALSAEEAVGKATEMAREGYQVLLSPACASFDLFDNYEDRGKKFKNAIYKLNN